MREHVVQDGIMITALFFLGLPLFIQSECAQVQAYKIASALVFCDYIIVALDVETCLPVAVSDILHDTVFRIGVIESASANLDAALSILASCVLREI